MCIPLFFTANKEIHISVINLATKLLLDETQNKTKSIMIIKTIIIKKLTASFPIITQK